MGTDDQIIFSQVKFYKSCQSCEGVERSSHHQRRESQEK